MSNEVFGKLGDKLPEKIFLAGIREFKTRMENVLAILVSGKQVQPEANRRDVEEAIKLYGYLMAHPIDFKEKVVRGHLASLPISIAANPIMVDRDIAVHLGVSYTFKDYSAIVPAAVKEKFAVYPVSVFNFGDGKKKDWRDPVITRINHKEIVLPSDPKAYKTGVYTNCVGIAPVWGGSVTPCPYEDQVRMMDQPRHRCEVCTGEFSKIRAKMRRTGRVESSKTIVSDLLDLLG